MITGITGQDGSYLAEVLLAQGYRVVGIMRPDSTSTYNRLATIRKRVELCEASLLDLNALKAVIDNYKPQEIYNFAARASSSQLFSEPLLTSEFNGMSVARLLEAIRTTNPSIRFCQASSSEMFGAVDTSPQNESTPFRPKNPYGIAKLFAHGMVGSYRETHNIFACSGILFNHESPRRGHEFVTRKISMGVAKINAGLESALHLGSLDACRDWGYALDYVVAMWKMLQTETPDDYVIATGKSHSVEEFCDIAFSRVGRNYRDYVVLDPQAKRPKELVARVGDPSKARRALDWLPSVSFEHLVCMMVDADVEALAS